MTRTTLFVLGAVAALAGLGACAREDGQPDPTPAALVPCDTDAAAGDPLACPPPADAGADGD